MANSINITTAGGNTPVTMSSVEIAEITGKRHDHVMRDIKTMMDELNMAAPNFGGSYVGGNGKALPCFNLPKRECLILVSGYSVELRAKIIDRLDELERVGAVSIADLLAHPTRLLALTEGYARQIEAMRSDVAVLDRIAKSDDLFGVRQTAQILQMDQNKFVAWSMQIGWVFRQHNNRTLMGYADKRKAGLVTHKLETFSKPDGSEGTREVLKFTPAGVVKLAKMLSVDVDLSKAA